MLKVLFRSSALVLSILISWSALAVGDASEIDSLLSRLTSAVRQQNYSGVYTYEHSGRLEVLSLDHAVIDGLEFEKVSYLNGPPRSVLKSGRPSDCETFGGRLLEGASLKAASGGLAQLSSYYKFHLLDNDRVSGRETWNVHFQPLDEHRHGVILSIDKISGLPLKYMVVAQGRKVLERLHVVSLETNAVFNRSDFSSSESVANYSESCLSSIAEIEVMGWAPAWVPPGFVLANYDQSSQDGQVATYTDGIASFSVFISSSDLSPGVRVKPSLVKRGATTVISSVVSSGKEKSVQVTVLGEIPAATVNKIYSSVQKL